MFGLRQHPAETVVGPEPDPPAIRAVGVRKSYPGVEAVRGIDLTVEQGETWSEDRAEVVHHAFTPAQVVTEMTRRGTGYAESTIRTMVTAHMCRNAPDNAGTTYDDLERIDRGVYRLTSMD
ncbi:MAG: hypothetical protein JWP48_4240 [Actinoallomurus sp.]|jgi:hypothetical protein|nr:hypothetical protein [Actinoallomurus sp.]